MYRIRRYLCEGWAYNTHDYPLTEGKTYEIETFDGEDDYISLLILYDPNNENPSDRPGIPITFRVDYPSLNAEHYIRTTDTSIRKSEIHPITTEPASDRIFGHPSFVDVPTDFPSNTYNSIDITPVESTNGPKTVVQFKNTLAATTGSELILSTPQTTNFWALLQELLERLDSVDPQDTVTTDRVGSIPHDKDVLPSGEQITFSQ